MIEVGGIEVTEEMQNAGRDVGEYLYDATCKKALGGLDVEDYPALYRNLIGLYLDDKICSATAIYIAMKMFEED